MPSDFACLLRCTYAFFLIVDLQCSPRVDSTISLRQMTQMCLLQSGQLWPSMQELRLDTTSDAGC
jgi:hypothetical protein